jgi:predicted HAD superfamily Cof-like phosphohydrolase
MDKTNFEKVIDFCVCANHPVHATNQVDIFDTRPDRVSLRLALIEEEVRELKQAIEEKNFTEVIDALSDILYVTYGAGAEFGINLDKTFDLVHESNMTKFCTNENDAIATVEWYKENEANRYKNPAYRKVDGKDQWVIYDADTDKILKSIKYHPVKFLDSV